MTRTHGVKRPLRVIKAGRPPKLSQLRDLFRRVSREPATEPAAPTSAPGVAPRPAARCSACAHRLGLHPRSGSALHQALLAGGHWFEAPDAPTPTGQVAHPVGITFDTGGEARFPNARWPELHRARVKDYLRGTFDYGAEVCAPNQAARLGLDLAYASPQDYPTVVQHARALQALVGRYFGGVPAHEAWILVDIPVEHPPLGPVPATTQRARVVFSTVLVDASRARQLALSANILLEAKFELRDAVQPGPAPGQPVVRRPALARRLIPCATCHNHPSRRLGCGDCFRAGVLPAPGVLRPCQHLASNGSGHGVAGQLPETVPDLERMLAATALVPSPGSGALELTPGFQVPPGEPPVVPAHASHPKHVYKRDNAVLSRRKAYLPIADAEVHKLVHAELSAMHPQYQGGTLDLEWDARTTTLYVNLRGRGRTFCRMQDKAGVTHTDNRVWFKISRNAKRQLKLTQHCYNLACKSRAHPGHLEWCQKTINNMHAGIIQNIVRKLTKSPSRPPSRAYNFNVRAPLG